MSDIERYQTVAVLSLEVVKVREELGKARDRLDALARRRHELAVELVAAGATYLQAARLCGFTNGRVSQLVAVARKKGREFPNTPPEHEWLRTTKPRRKER